MANNKTPKKENWEPWHIERIRFQTRKAEGYLVDLKALEIHIKKLINLAPKDKAGWPVGRATILIDALKRDFERYQSWGKDFGLPVDTPGPKFTSIEH